MTSRAYTSATTLPTEENITKANNKFKGWYDNSSYTGNPVTSIQANTVGPHEFWAKWNPSWIVSFDLVSGTEHPVSGNITNAPANQNIENGFNATKPATNPSANNYQFLGWYTDDTFATEFNFTTVTISGDTTIYAKWHQVQTYELYLI